MNHNKNNKKHNKQNKKQNNEEIIINDLPPQSVTENIEPIPTEPEFTPQKQEKETETQGIGEYLKETNLRLGIDYREKIEFPLDGTLKYGIIRPLSSDEFAQIQQTSQMGQGSVEKLILSVGFYDENNNHIALSTLEKFPGGVTTLIASEIMRISGYDLNIDQINYLKKP